jgi:hypothetical protein
MRPSFSWDSRRCGRQFTESVQLRALN